MVQALAIMAPGSTSAAVQRPNFRRTYTRVPAVAPQASHRGATACHPAALYRGTRRGSNVATYSLAGSGPSGLAPDLKQKIDTFVTSNKIVLFIKGTRQFPQCGFSQTVVTIVERMGVPYETINILENEALRSGMKEYSQWPTFPQVYIDGEFFGGCDIMLQSYQNGELKEAVEKALMS